MNSKQFQYVLTIVNTGSLSNAADVLNISQPSLSQYVKKIEKQLGVELFERTNGNLRLTDAGHVYVETARKVLELERRMENRFVDISEHKSGSVIVGTTPFRSASMMPAIVSAFKQEYPGVHIIVDERGTQELKEAAERGEFDICIVNLPVDERTFHSEVIMEEELVIAVPKNSELDVKLGSHASLLEGRRHKAIDAGLLHGQSFIMITEAQIMQKALADLCKDHGLQLHTAAVVKSLEAQIEMVRAGIAAALVPTGIEKFGGSDDRISYFSLIQELPGRKVAAIYRKDKHLSGVLQDLLHIIKGIDW